MRPGPAHECAVDIEQDKRAVRCLHGRASGSRGKKTHRHECRCGTLEACATGSMVKFPTMLLGDGMQLN
jgi:hypothetical protein